MKHIRTEILGSPKYLLPETSESPVYIPLDIEDHDFMLELFKYHKHYKEKFTNYLYLAVGEFLHKEKKSKCFFVCPHKESSNKPVDISYLKSVQYLFENLREKQTISAFSPDNLKRVSLISSLIDKLLKIFPLTKEPLLQELSSQFVHKRRPVVSLQIYLFFLLELSLVIFKVFFAFFSNFL